MSMKVYDSDGNPSPDIKQVQIRNPDNTGWIDIKEIHHSVTGGPTPNFQKVWSKNNTPFLYAKIVDSNSGPGTGTVVLVPNKAYRASTTYDWWTDGIYIGAGGFSASRDRAGIVEPAGLGLASLYDMTAVGTRTPLDAGEGTLADLLLHDPEFAAIVGVGGNNLPYKDLCRNIIVIGHWYLNIYAAEDTVTLSYDPTADLSPLIRDFDENKLPAFTNIPLTNLMSINWTPDYVNNAYVGSQVYWGHYQDITNLYPGALETGGYTIDAPPAENDPVGWWAARNLTGLTNTDGLFCTKPTTEPMSTLEPARWTPNGIQGGMLARSAASDVLTWPTNLKTVTYNASKWFAIKAKGLPDGVGFHQGNWPGYSDMYVYEDSSPSRRLRTRIRVGTTPVPQAGMPLYNHLAPDSNNHVLMITDYSANKAVVYLGETGHAAESTTVTPLPTYTNAALTDYNHFEVGNLTPSDRPNNSGVQFWAWCANGTLTPSDVQSMLRFMEEDLPFFVGGYANAAGTEITLQFSRAVAGDPNTGFFFAEVAAGSTSFPLQFTALTGGTVSGNRITFPVTMGAGTQCYVRYRSNVSDLVDSSARPVRGFIEMLPRLP